MAWIESHQQLGRHPKLLKLAGTLRIHRAQAIGHLHYLWWWALDYASYGDVSALTSAEIAAAAEWPGDVRQFHAALKEVGWIDQNGQLHDWMDYAGKLVEQRKVDRERKRLSRGHPPDIHRKSGVDNPTQPDPTQPDQKQARPRAAEAPVVIPEDLLASEPEIRDWLEYKRQRKQGYKPGKGLEALWRAFRMIRQDRRRAAVDHSMANNWSGLFEPKGGRDEKAHNGFRGDGNRAPGSPKGPTVTL
jgi:hypothetical protein